MILNIHLYKKNFSSGIVFCISLITMLVSLSAIAKEDTYITMDADRDLLVNLGVFGGGDPLFKKKLATGKGKSIVIKDFYVWSFNDSDWMNGGRLHLINDDSLGAATRVTCSISSAEGDKFMADKNRRSTYLTGTIKNYSNYGGLEISPCSVKY